MDSQTDFNVTLSGKFKRKACLESLLDSLDLSSTWQIARRRYSLHGRHFKPEPMLKALILKEIRQISSRRKLANFLASERFWMEKCGFTKPPAHNTFSKFIKRLGEDVLKSILNELIAQLKKLEPCLGKIVAVDSTLIKAYAKGPNKGEPIQKWTDPDDRWKFNPAKGKQKTKAKWFFGYQVQMAIDAELELPLGLLVTPANRYDSPLYREVLKDVAEKGFRFQEVLADAGYDSKANIAETRVKYQATAFIVMNPRTSKRAYRRRPWETIYIYPFKQGTKTWKKHYALRTAAERVFSRLKGELCFDQLKVRRLWRVNVHFMISVMAILAVALAAWKINRPELARKINAFKF